MNNWVLKDSLSICNLSLYGPHCETRKVCNVDWILTFNEHKSSLTLKCKNVTKKFLIRMVYVQGGPGQLKKNYFDQLFLQDGIAVEFKNLVHLKLPWYWGIDFYMPIDTATNLIEKDTENKLDRTGCSNSIRKNKEITSETTSGRVEILSLMELSNNFSSLREREILSDVEIQCGTEIFRAHKAILASRSAFFAAMFQTRMKETLENSVVVKDVRPEILQMVLDYIYSGKIEILTDLETACELLFAADLYVIPRLKRICTEFLKSLLSVSNALRLLIFADLHDEDLKDFVVQFICDNFDSLKKSEEWINIQKQNPALAIIVLNEKVQKLSCSK